MRSPPPNAQHDIDLSTLPALIRKSIGPLAIATVAVGMLTYAVLLLVPSRFSSEAQIRIGGPQLSDSPRTIAGTPESVAVRVDREAVASRVQELRSPDLARQLVRELQLNLRPEFNSALDSQGILATVGRVLGVSGPRRGETEEERVLAAYYRSLEVFQVKDTRVITLGFSARDGELAARVANRLVELYQDSLRLQGVTETTDANAWLVPEIAKRTRELSVAEAEVERFRSRANLFKGGGVQPSGLAEQQLSDLTTELTRMRGQRSEAEARAQAARELMTRGQPDTIPDVQRSPVIQGLIAQRVRAEREFAEAASTLLPAHPRMKQLNANVADLRRQVQREAATIVDGLEREAKALALREELANRTIEDAKARVGNKAEDRVKLAQLEDEAKAKRRELEGLRDRLEASRSRGTTKAVPVEVQVIATAMPSSRPSSPNRPQIAGLAAAATFVLGLVLVLFRALMRGGRQPVSPSHAAHQQAPQPARVPEPRAAASAPRPRQETGAANRSATAKAAQTALEAGTRQALKAGGAGAVVERLVRNSAGQAGYRTMIVGDAPGVDARREAIEIAGGLAAAGRQVVVVDWGRDARGLAELLQLEPTPGFSEMMAGSATFEDVIRSLPDDDVHIVPSGMAPVATLDADRLNLLLDALDEAYDDVMVTGTHAEIKELFVAIEGRVDAGVLVGGARNRGAPTETGNRFLGYEVTEIDVIRLDAGVASMMAGRVRDLRRAPRDIGGPAAATAGA